MLGAYLGQLYPGGRIVVTATTISGAGGFDSGAAFGSPTVAASITVSDATIGASGAAFGAPVVTFDVDLAGATIPSAAAWGTPVLPGPATGFTKRPAGYPAGLYPAGGWVLLTGAIIPPGGFESGAVFGEPTVQPEVQVSGASVGESGASFGAPSVDPVQVVAMLMRRYAGGFYPGGMPVIVNVGTISGASIPSQAVWGAPSLTGPVTLEADSITSPGSGFGTPGIGAARTIFRAPFYPGGFYPAAASASTALLLVSDAGIPSQAAWGTPGVSIQAFVSGAGGFESVKAWGVPTLILGIISTYDPSSRRRPAGISCGDYDVAILARGGGRRLVEVPASEIVWGRAIDAVSEATVTLEGISARCRRDLADVDAWSHELGIYRNGVRCWSGPIQRLQLGADATVIEAADLMAWFGVWWVWSDHSYPADVNGAGTTDLAVIFNAIAADAASQDNTPGVLVTATPCGVLGSYEATAAEHRVAADDLESLTRTGIDWTVVDRQVIAGGAAVPTTPFAYFTDQDFAAPPTIVRDGTAGAIRWGARGAGAGAGTDPVWGEYGPQDATYATLRARYGMVARQLTDDALGDANAALARAKTRWDANHSPPSVITDAVLAPGAAVKINDLVMGRIADVRLDDTLVPIHTRYRMGTLQGSVTSESEQLRVTFQPVGTT